MASVPIADADAWMPGVKRLVIPNRTVVLDPTLVMLHTNSNGNSTTPEQLYASIINALNNGNTGVTRPHFDIGSDGEIVQMVPINRRGATCWHAEPWAIGIETQDAGYLHGTPDTEPWTPAQMASISAVCAWIASVTQIPLERGAPMKPVTSGSTTWWQGFGYEGHCASHLIPGDTRKYEYPQTSEYEGKVCPGHARLAQIDGILASAALILHPSIPTPPTPPAPTYKETNMFIIATVDDAFGKGYWLYGSGGFTHLMPDIFADLSAAGVPELKWNLARCNEACDQFGLPHL